MDNKKGTKRCRIEICLNEQEAAYVRGQCEAANLTAGQLAKRCLLKQEVRPFAAEQDAVRRIVRLRSLIGNAGLSETEQEDFMEEMDKLCRCLNI